MRGWIGVVCVCSWLACNSATAAVITTGNGSGNTTAPADDPGWANIGNRGGASAIYLGDSWVLTANHVGSGSTWFGSTQYAAIPGSDVRLLNPPGFLSTYTDLLMYRIDGAPNLPGLSIGASAPPVGSQVTMIGRGRDRMPNLTYWDQSWVETASPSVRSGYKWGSANTLRWGTNIVDMNHQLHSVQGSWQMSFTVDFDQTGGTAYEAQGAVGDSGGGVFYKNPSTGMWELSGVMFAINQFGGQPWASAVFGNQTYIAELATYRDQILAILPDSVYDLNGDGLVDIFDVGIVSANWGTSGPLGDVNNDNLVDMFDLGKVVENWSGAGGAAGTSVPEPSTWALAAFGAAALCGWAARRQRRLLN